MTTNEIYELMCADYRQRTGYDILDTCDLAVRLYAAAAQLETLYSYAEWSRRQAFVQTASGSYLDYHGQTRGIARKQAACARGTLRFLVPAALDRDVLIPAGTVVTTTSQTRFRTLQGCELDAGELYIDCEAIAEEPGSAGNISPDTAVCLTFAPTGVSACTNPSAFTGGMDAEDDETYRTRLLASFLCPSNGANAAFYKQTALAHAGVCACSVLPKNRGVGTVDVVIAAPDGVPSATLRTAVQSELAAQRELAVDVQVIAPGEVSIDITASLKPADGVSYAQAEAAVSTALNAFFTGELLGRPIYKAMLGNLIYMTGAVKNYTLQAPLGDYQITASQLPVLGTLTLLEET